MEENTPFFKNYGPSYVGVSPYLQNNETPAKFRAAKQNKKTAEGENINRIKESKNSSPLEFPDSRRLARSNPIEICCAPNIRTSYGSPPVPSIASPGKLIRRHAHQTHLEAFGSKEIWVTLLVPVLLTIAAFILTYEYRFSSIVLTYPHCISDQFCALSSQLQYTLPNPVPFQEVVRSYIEIHDSRNVTNCIDNHCGSGHISAEMGIIDTVNNRPMRQENIVYADSINLFSYYQTYYSYKNDSSAHVATFYLPLKAATTDLPGMHSKRLSHRLLFVGDTNHLDTTQFVRVSYHISVENVHYMIVGAVVSLIGSIITAVVIVRSFLAIWRTASRHKNQSDEARSSIPSSLMDSMSSEDDGRYSKTIHFVLPEQIIGLSLMITLLVWQDPAGNVFSLLYYFEVVNINRLVVLASGYLRSCAMYGILVTLVAFIDGLKCTTAKPFLRNSHLDSGNSREYRKAYDPFDLSSGTQQKPTEKDAEFWKKDMASIGLNTKFNPLLRNYGSIYSNNSTDDEIKVVSNKFKLSKHHICSSEYFEFAFWKIFWFTMSCIVCSLYWLTKFPKICGLPFDTAQQQRNMILLNRLGEIAIIAVLFGWLFWLCEKLSSTGKRLAGVRYVYSRFRQLTYKVIAYQINLALLLFAGITAYFLCSNIEIVTSFQYKSIQHTLHFVQLWWNHFYITQFLLPASILNSRSLEVLVFVSSLVYVINFAMLPPRSEFMGSNRSKGNSRYQPIEEFENSDGNEGRHSNKPDKLVASEDLQDAHAIVVMERDMPYLKKWKPQDLKNKQLELLAKDLFSGNLDRFIKRYLNYLKPIKVYQLFCLETACILMEASYQAYFPVRLEDKKLPQSAKHPQNMRENHDIFKDVSETYIGKLGIASTRDLGNPFVDESETGDGATLNYGPQLDLDRLGISLLSTFQCGVYSVFGFLSYSDKYLLVSFRGSTSDNYYTDINLAQVPLPVLEMSLDYFAELLKNVLGTDNGAKSIGDSEVHVNVDAGISNDYGLGSLTNLHHLDESHELGDRVDKAPSSYSDTYEDELSSQLLLTPAADYYLEDMNDKISAADLDVGFSPPAMNTSVVSESDLYFGNSKSSNTMLEGRLNHDIEDGLTSHGLNRVDEQGSLSHAALKSSAPYKGSSPSGISGSMSHCCRTICTSIPILKQNFPRVHHGFLQSYLSIREQFIQSILQAIVRHRLEHARIRDGVRRRDLYSNNRKMPSELDLYFTGHSLGGAISVLAALDLAINIDTMIKAVVRSELSELSNNQQAEWMLKVKSWKRPTLTVYTFGSPRMGNAKFAQLVINKVDSIYRLVVDGDLITMLPSVPGFYRHVGTQVIIDDDGKGSIIINPSVIEHSILKRSTGSLANHSLEKYRFCLEACFDPSELNEYMAREYLTTTMAVNKNSSFGNKTRPEDIPEWLLMK